jgi:hypothetical protein
MKLLSRIDFYKLLIIKHLKYEISINDLPQEIREYRCVGGLLKYKYIKGRGVILREHTIKIEGYPDIIIYENH